LSIIIVKVPSFVYLPKQTVRGKKWRAAARAQGASSADGLPKEVDVKNRAHELLFESTKPHDDTTLAC
jgi:hypothetical protein